MHLLTNKQVIIICLIAAAVLLFVGYTRVIIPMANEAKQEERVMNAAIETAVKATIEANLPTPMPTPPPTVLPTPMQEHCMLREGCWIETGLGSRAEVTVQGFADNPSIFNMLFQIIDEEERLLGVAFPAPKVQVTRVNSIPGGFCGQNEYSQQYAYSGNEATVESSNITIRVDGECEDTFGMIAHEVAHTWFWGEHPWLDEGLANSLEYQIREDHPEEGPIHLPVTYCATYRNIAELERANPGVMATNSASDFTCNYTLGDGIFGALREHLGTEAFNQGIAQLSAGNITGGLLSRSMTGSTMEDVIRAMGHDAKAMEIIDTWYSGQPEMRIFQHLDLVDYTYPPTIDGPYLHFAGRIRAPGLVHEPILEHNNYCSQFALHQGLADPLPQEGPTDPLPVGWTHESIPDAAVINSEINPASGEFSVTARVNNAQLLGGKDLSLQVVSRVTAGQDGNCEESTIYSHILIESGRIPDQLKKVRHYHNDQIAWDWRPQVSNHQIHLSGKAPPRSLSFQDRDNYCNQIDLYRMDESGYHWISSVEPLLTAGQQWADNPRAEIISGSTEPNGRFEAIIQIWDANVLNHRHVVLVIDRETSLNTATNQCAPSNTMSAVSLVGN